MAWLAAAAPIIGAVGAGISAIGAVRQGEAQSAEANYQAQVAQNNQVIAQQNAAYATSAGERQTYDVGLQQRARAGSIRAGIAANNLDVNTGSAAEVRASQAQMGQVAEETTKANAALTAYGYRTQGTSFGAEAQLKRAEAPQDVTAGFLSGGGLLLSGASNAGFKWNALSSPAASSAWPTANMF
jgi:hypothetical protein